MDERVEQLVDDATVGLKDDPELRLDVRAELRSHIREREEGYLADGHGEDESTELALKSFGSPVDIAGELLDANKGRMKLRALARLFVRALLVPAAVLIALVIVLDTSIFNHSVDPNDIDLYSPMNIIPRASWWSSPAERQRLQQLRFLLKGDERRATRADQLRAIWERNRNSPEGKFYFAYYAVALFEAGGTKEKSIASVRTRAHESDAAFRKRTTSPAFVKDLLSPAKMTSEAMNRFEQEMRLGEKIDPENALYNYLLAAKWLDVAVERYTIEQPDPHARRKETFRIKDRALLDQAMHELQTGLTKPYCSRYHKELARQWVELLPPTRRWRDLANQMNNLDNLEIGNQYSKFVRLIPFYAKLADTEGKRDEALQYMQCFPALMTQIADDAFAPIEFLVIRTIARSALTLYPPTYEALGRRDLARQFRISAERLAKNNFFKRKTQTTDKYGGFISGIYLPIYDGYYSRAELTPERTVSQLLVEEITTGLLILTLIGLLLRSYLLATRHLLGRRDAGAVPLLLLPKWKDFVRIIGLTIILPLGLYFIYSRWSGIAGREYGISYGWVRMTIELLTLMLLLVILPSYVTSRVLRRRCKSLGVPIPPQKRTDGIRSFFGTLVWLLFWGVALYLFSTLLPSPWSFAVLVVALCLGAVIVIKPWARKSPNEYGLYYGTLSRSLLPLYAAAIILIGSLGYTCLVHSEQYWVARDRLIFTHSSEDAGRAPIEQRVADQLRRQVHDALHDSTKRKEK